MVKTIYYGGTNYLLVLWHYYGIRHIYLKQLILTYFSDNGEYTYLIQVSGDKGDGITCGCHLDEATEDSVPQRCVFIHTMEEIA